MKMSFLSVLLVGAGIFLVNCGNEDQSSEKGKKERVPIEINQIDIAAALSDLKSADESRFSFQEVDRISLSYYSQENPSGNISQVAVGSEDNLFLLDNHKMEITHFDKDGRLLQTIGEIGTAPGNFQRPTGIIIHQDSLLLVGDSGKKVEIFKKGGSWGFDYYKTIEVTYTPWTMCTIENQLFISAFNYNADVGKTVKINRINLEDTEDRFAFGEAFESDSKILVNSLSNGRVYCDEENKQVIFAPLFFPLIESYSMEGRLLWSTNINTDNISQVIENEMEDGSDNVSFTMPETGFFDRIVSISSLGDEVMVHFTRVVVQEFGVNPSIVEPEVYNLFLDSKTGKLVETAESPFLFVTESKNHFYARGSYTEEIDVLKVRVEKRD